MKITFVIAPFAFSQRFGTPFPIGIGYLATVLSKNGHTIDILDCHTVGMDRSQLKNYFLEKQPDIVGVTATSHSRFTAIEILNIAKTVLPSCVTVVGGPHFTPTAQDALNYVKSIDYVVRGEGENTIVDLVAAIEQGRTLKEIDGLSYRDSGRIIHNKERELIKDLDSLPILDRNLVNDDFYFELLPHSNIVCKSVVASRGCPFNCAFCFSHDKSYRRRSAVNILDEVESVMKRYGVEAIRFFDLTFTANPKTVVEFCDEIKRRKLEFKWYCESRVDIDFKLLEIMKDAGCYSLDFGLESASEKVLKIINKKIYPEQAFNFAKKCKELGIKAKVFLMISLPGEDRLDAEKTYDFACQISKYVTNVGVGVTNIYPGTQVEARANYLGILSKDFSWNSPIDFRKTKVFLKSELVPLYIEKLSLNEIWDLYRKFSMFEVFEIKRLKFATLKEKFINGLTKWDKGIMFKLRWVFSFLRYGFSRLIKRSRS